jgi:hypothetical protein
MLRVARRDFPTLRQVVYRRYASLFVLAGVDGDENALAVLELVHAFVEALDRYFGAVCELDIMFHLDKARARRGGGAAARSGAAR